MHCSIDFVTLNPYQDRQISDLHLSIECEVQNSLDEIYMGICRVSMYRDKEFSNGKDCAPGRSFAISFPAPSTWKLFVLDSHFEKTCTFHNFISSGVNSCAHCLFWVDCLRAVGPANRLCVSPWGTLSQRKIWLPSTNLKCEQGAIISFLSNISSDNHSFTQPFVCNCRLLSNSFTLVTAELTVPFFDFIFTCYSKTVSTSQLADFWTSQLSNLVVETN